ncbi:hypothetical protein HCU66_07620 [Pseudomonas frederiksbergensis]|uniref:hypothetical protein n=1 Tax=Pseudomonas frederiksbergensis TaxID=104087 RepID=UPI00197D6D71|nr:hypothetical protein [Pseudomonas frederiksbergensis]MBN3862096.1 hypothetical protein [Pseudomonas frederiksbergensis]
MTEFFKIVTTTELTTQPNISGFDFLARVSRSTSSNVTQISTIETQTFVSRFLQLQSEWKDDVRLLNDVINWQHKINDFNSSYAAYLLEQIDDEEFDKVAEALAYEELDTPPIAIVPVIGRLLELTTLDYTPSDLANMFHCSQETVQEALALLPDHLIDAHPSLIEISE